MAAFVRRGERRQRAVLVEQDDGEPVVEAVAVPAGGLGDRQVDPVAVRKLHQVADEFRKVLIEQLVFIGALVDEQLAEIQVDGGRLVRLQVAHEIDDVEVVERVGFAVRVRAGTVQNHGADVIVRFGVAEDQVVHFLFAAHRRYASSYSYNFTWEICAALRGLGSVRPAEAALLRQNRAVRCFTLHFTAFAGGFQCF